MSLLYNLLKQNKLTSAGAALACLLATAVALNWNAHLSGVIDMVAAGVKPPYAAVSRALCIMVVMGMTNFIKSWLEGYACESMSHDLRMGYAGHFAALPFIETEHLNAGEQLSKLQNEITGVSGYLNGNLFQLFDDMVKFIMTFTWLIAVNPALTLISNLPAFLIIFYVVWSSKVIGSAAEASQKAQGDMNRHADTLIGMFPVIRLYDAARTAAKGYENAVGEWTFKTIRMERTKARLMSLSAVLSNIPLLILFFSGGHMAINGALSVGTLYIFLNLSGNVSGVMMNMPRYITAFRQFAAGAKRLAPYIKF